MDFAYKTNSGNKTRTLESHLYIHVGFYTLLRGFTCIFSLAGGREPTLRSGRESR